MLETKEAGQARPTLPGAAAPAGTLAKPGPAHTPRFTVAAHSDNVVLVDIVTGRSWALALDEHQPVWQPVLFAGQAERAPPPLAAKERD
jgi:hypothetical protein